MKNKKDYLLSNFQSNKIYDMIEILKLSGFKKDDFEIKENAYDYFGNKIDGNYSIWISSDFYKNNKDKINLSYKIYYELESRIKNILIPLGYEEEDCNLINLTKIQSNLDLDN